MMIRADSPRYKWILVGVLFLAASLNYADRGALTAVFPLLRKDLGMSDLALAAIGSFFLWSYALFSPLAGYLGDRFSRSALVTWSVVAWSVVTALTAFVQTSGATAGNARAAGSGRVALHSSLPGVDRRTPRNSHARDGHVSPLVRFLRRCGIRWDGGRLPGRLLRMASRAVAAGRRGSDSWVALQAHSFCGAE